MTTWEADNKIPINTYIMNVLIVLNTHLPVVTYGGTERVVWYLAHELQKKGHKVTFLAAAGSVCPFAECLPYLDNEPIDRQIPEYIDVVHFQNSTLGYNGKKPYIVTYHGNFLHDIDRNAVFVSKNHAKRNNSESYVHNGLDWDDYGPLNLSDTRGYFHFLGKAAWRVKNLKGAIDIVKALPKEKLYVLGGSRLNFKMGFRFTLSPRIKFYGMVGGKDKITLLQHSRGLIFPVRWHEPFGLAITESLYCGAPVFGTTYGSLPELIPSEVGFLTNSKKAMVEHIVNEYDYSPKRCHEYAKEMFNSRLMAERYITKYEMVMNGNYLNNIQPHPQPNESRERKDFPFE